MGRRAGGKDLAPGLVARPGPEHARLVDTPDAVPLQQQRQAGDVVLVGMAEHEDVDPAVPRRQPFLERQQQPRWVRPAIDDEASASTALDEDPVALPDVEHGDPGMTVRSMDEDQPQPDRGDD